mmetsp:Transcript_36313/g.56742  ORF Transcript_36313/g.56742 Transcript_36313/m.56742 type:complete len:212 (-) Transcript_36313:353-988(-)
MNSHDSTSMETLFFRAEVCKTAVRNPVGKVKKPMLYTTGYVPSVQSDSCLILSTKSRDHAAKGFIEGYPLIQLAGILPSNRQTKISSKSAVMTTIPFTAFRSSASCLRTALSIMLYLSISWNSTTCRALWSSCFAFMHCSRSIGCGTWSSKSFATPSTMSSREDPAPPATRGCIIKIDSNNSFVSSIWDAMSAFPCCPNASGASKLGSWAM